MDTNDIINALQGDRYTRPLFSGVYAADQLPLKVPRPSLCVANTDIASRRGVHSVGFYLPKHGPCEYFDSYGFKPLVKYHFDFIKRNGARWIHNSQDLQALGTTVCGQYCIVYLMYRARGYTMTEFLSNFSKTDLLSNDRLVSIMCDKLVNRTVKLYRKHLHCPQCCSRRTL